METAIYGIVAYYIGIAVGYYLAKQKQNELPGDRQKN